MFPFYGPESPRFNCRGAKALGVFGCDRDPALLQPDVDADDDSGLQLSLARCWDWG